MNPRENMLAFQQKLNEVQNHCMCAKFQDVDGKFRVIYPEGFYPNGAQVSQGMGKIAALERLLEVMERHWKENY